MPLEDLPRLHLSINYFMNSLAEDQGAKAIEVILSGTASETSMLFSIPKGSSSASKSFGLFVIIPPLIYIEGLRKSQFTGSFFQSFPHLFAKDALTFDPVVFSNYGHHLWFLAFLFIFSLLDLLIAGLFQTRTGQSFIAGNAVFLEKKGAIFLSVVPLVFIQVVMRVKYSVYCSWTDF